MEMDPSKLCGGIFEISEVTGYATEGLRDTYPPPPSRTKDSSLSRLERLYAAEIWQQWT